ncbi:MAG: amidohydrolase [Pyrinomonadaceae bacterium]
MKLPRTFFRLLTIILLACAFIVFPIAQVQAAPKLVALVIRGGTIVTMNERGDVIEDGAIAIERGRIVAIGKRADIDRNYAGRETIEARGRVVMPGLINGHTHVPMTLFRGLADDLDLNEWLTKYIFPAEAKNVTEDFVRVGTRLGLAEMIRGGTTTYCDMYYFEDAVADETAKAGVRGVLGETIIDFPAPDNKTYEEGLAYTRKYIEKWRGHALITPAIAPHAAYTVSEEHLKAARDLANRLQATIVIHVAESRKELDDITRDHGASPVNYLARIGFLNDQVIAAHTIYLTDEEIVLLKRLGVGAVHNPQSNMKLAAGVARVPQMLQADVAVGLGTDGAASNNDLNLWEEMDTAAKLHKITTGDPRVITAREALEMGTIRGARALHLERETGSLERGKRADVIIVDMDNLNQTPLYNLYSQLVYATKAADVRTVVIEGRVVMRDRRLLTLDEEAIKRDARAYRQRISQSLTPASVSPAVPEKEASEATRKSKRKASAPTKKKTTRRG